MKRHDAETNLDTEKVSRIRYVEPYQYKDKLLKGAVLSISLGPSGRTQQVPLDSD